MGKFDMVRVAASGHSSNVGSAAVAGGEAVLFSKGQMYHIEKPRCNDKERDVMVMLEVVVVRCQYDWWWYTLLCSLASKVR